MSPSPVNVCLIITILHSALIRPFYPTIHVIYHHWSLLWNEETRCTCGILFGGGETNALKSSYILRRVLLTFRSWRWLTICQGLRSWGQFRKNKVFMKKSQKNYFYVFSEFSSTLRCTTELTFFLFLKMAVKIAHTFDQ